MFQCEAKIIGDFSNANINSSDKTTLIDWWDARCSTYLSWNLSYLSNAVEEWHKFFQALIKSIIKESCEFNCSSDSDRRNGPTESRSSLITSQLWSRHEASLGYFWHRILPDKLLACFHKAEWKMWWAEDAKISTKLSLSHFCNRLLEFSASKYPWVRCLFLPQLECFIYIEFELWTKQKIIYPVMQARFCFHIKHERKHFLPLIV